MGSFLGHVVPGSFFIIFGLWGLTDAFVTYFFSRFRRVPYENKSGFQSLRVQGSCCPWEGFLKTFAVVFGMLGEFVTGFGPDGNFGMHNGQHMTMFLFFGIHGAVEVFYFYKLNCLPKKVDYITGALAFVMEGVLFSWHLHGRSPLDIQVHILLLYTVWACAFATIFEMFLNKDFIFALIRHGVVILQGTWFWQIGFILYSPFGTVWNQDGHRETLVVSMFFTWHVAAVVLIAGIIGSVTFTKIKCKYRDSTGGDYDKIENQSLLEET